MEPVIEAQELTRRFGTTLAVDRLSLTVEQGQVFGFLGPNGAGKTTTIRLLNGILSPSAGTAHVLGYDVRTEPNEVRRRTGVLTETPSLYESLTARQNLRFFGDVYGVPEGRLPERIAEVLEEMGLSERADEPVAAYSKGMKQRLAVGRALLHEPPLLFLDEPTAGLDPEAARMVTEMIAQLSHQQGRTILLCTHNLVEAQRLCDRVGVISQGALRAIGSPEELAHQLWNSLWVELDLHGQMDEPILAALRSQPHVRTVAAQQGRLRVELDDQEQIPDVVRVVVSAGGRVYGVAVEQHSLEDVYFELQGTNHHHAAIKGEA